MTAAAGCSPFLAGDDPDLLALAVGRHQPGLPPLVVGGVDDVQDVPVGEAEPLAGQAAVPGPVIVKQGSAKEQKQQCLPRAPPGSPASKDSNPAFGEGPCQGEQSSWEPAQTSCWWAPSMQWGINSARPPQLASGLSPEKQGGTEGSCAWPAGKAHGVSRPLWHAGGQQGGGLGAPLHHLSPAAAEPRSCRGGRQNPLLWAVA